MESIDRVLIEGHDHKLDEYYLVKTKVVYEPKWNYYTEWFEGYPLKEGDEVVERWVGR